MKLILLKMPVSTVKRLCELFVTSVAFTSVKHNEGFWSFFFLSKLGLSFTKSFQLGICISDVFVGLDPQVPSMVVIEGGPSLTWSPEDSRAVLL